MDMSQAFRSGVAKHPPNAVEVFDRFHVMALAGKALDEIRREVAREEGGLETGAMRALRGNEGPLKAGQRELRERLPRQYSKLGRALSRREFLADTWRYATREDAEEHLAAVCSWGRRCRLQPIKKLCDHPAPLEGNPRLREPLDHERGHGGSQQLAPFGPQEGQGIPQLGELPNHRLLDRGRAQSRNRPAEPDPDALLNTIRFGEVPQIFGAEQPQRGARGLRDRHRRNRGIRLPHDGPIDRDGPVAPGP